MVKTTLFFLYNFYDNKLFVQHSKGFEDKEIDSMFKRYDVDGDNCLDVDEQDKMRKDLEDETVSYLTVKMITSLSKHVNITFISVSNSYLIVKTVASLSGQLPHCKK